METFKREFAEYLAQTVILSNAPKEEGDKLWIELNKLVLPNIPQKLFRFRGCSKYSFADFKNGKITTCVADRFPDEYDSMVYVNKEYIKNTIFSFYNAVAYKPFMTQKEVERYIQLLSNNSAKSSQIKQDS